MDTALNLVVLLTIVVAVADLSRRFRLPEPLLLIVVGVVGSYVPFVHNVELTPQLVLVGLLPPLLYAASIRTSLIDFRANRRPIALLSIGLVVFTTFGVAVVVRALIPVSFPTALALGAVVAPPDAVAASAIARRVGLPRRIVTILEGESLVNDATAIVTLRTAIAAISGSVSAWQIGFGFVVSALGGVLIGLVVAVAISQLRRFITDDLTDVAVSLLTPWIAYLPAEEIHIPGVTIHPSGVLAVVVAGVWLGHQSPLIQSASSRLFERTNWATISFVLESSVFLLIGLQIQAIVDDLDHSSLSAGRITVACAAVLAAVIVLRIVYLFPAVYVPRLIPRVRAADPAPPMRVPLVIGWAGMRGVVTLATVFLLPESTEHREVLVLMAFVVTAGTLMIQGLSLPWLVRRLGIEGPDPHEDHLQEATVYQAVTNAALTYLDDEVEGTVGDDVMHRLRERALDRTNAVWERLGGAETPSAAYSRVRTDMLTREREEVLRIRALGTVDQSLLQRILDALDVEESMIDRLSEDVTTAEREDDLRPAPLAGGCEHLRAAGSTPPPLTPSGCAECLRDGTDWVHLRLCMQCGHVGCCDSSVHRHASAHFQECAHPVMRSFEAGEAWRWCFVDELTG